MRVIHVIFEVTFSLTSVLTDFAGQILAGMGVPLRV